MPGLYAAVLAPPTLAATNIVGNWSHAGITRFLLEHALEDSIDNGSCATRGMSLAPARRWDRKFLSRFPVAV
jgi:hypothetical protein